MHNDKSVRHPSAMTNAHIRKVKGHSNNKYRKFNRELLPTPAAYYSKQFPGLKIKLESVTVRCCFHEDKNPSLIISMIDGHFYCFSCKTKGFDLLKFHCLRYNMNFAEAVDYFGARDYE